jgi:hypothetical protein
MASTKLKVPSVGQYEDEWCGPACAQMILLSMAIVPNKTKAVQQSLFNDIKANTGVGGGGFPIVERCGNRTLDWETFPTALEATLNARLGAPSVTVHHDANADTSTARMIRSVNGQMAAVVLTQDSTHWMVVFGWDDKQPRGAQLPHIVVGGQTIRHLFLRDPAWSYPSRIDLDEWVALQYTVDCGQFNNRFVVVAAP